MKKSIILLMVAILGIFSGVAQEEPQGKPNVFFDYFKYPSSIPFVWAEAIRNSVMDGIQKTNRVNLIDVDTKSTLAIERSRREQENASAGDDMDRLKVMTEEGANFLVTGIVTDVTSVEKFSDKGESLGYSASMAFTVKVIDPSNATTVFQESYTIPKNMLADFIKRYGKSADESVQICAQSIPKEMKKFVESAFPTVGKIIELDEVKGDDVKSAYINLGSDNGMAKGAKFEVRVKRLVGGSTSLKMLGEAEVVDVESENLSKVKIKKGGKLIYEAFKSGQELVVKSLK